MAAELAKLYRAVEVYSDHGIVRKSDVTGVATLRRNVWCAYDSGILPAVVDKPIESFAQSAKPCLVRFREALSTVFTHIQKEAVRERKPQYVAGVQQLQESTNSLFNGKSVLAEIELPHAIVRRDGNTLMKEQVLANIRQRVIEEFSGTFSKKQMLAVLLNLSSLTVKDIMIELNAEAITVENWLKKARLAIGNLDDLLPAGFEIANPYNRPERYARSKNQLESLEVLGYVYIHEKWRREWLETKRAYNKRTISKQT